MKSPAAASVDASGIKQRNKASEQLASVGEPKVVDARNEALKDIVEQTVSEHRNTSAGVMDNSSPGGKKEERASKPRPVDKYEAIINESAQKYGVNPALIKAVIMAESNGDPKAQSYAGARGLMQLMPSTAANLGVKNSFDPKQNIMAGTRYLRQLLDHYNGDTRLTLAAYNWGMGNLERSPQKMPSETRNYIAKVEGYYRDFVDESAPPEMLMA
ncbi:MAG: lytic transglycosylase domain-containing protein [Nitrospirae bacterium]|nr:lytic transglycosylase domain-containing protein [Nitrospirota bacterium]MBF0593272.1 lytic transglycosylase domain-containing protein [Nitrospirota bacterium]